MHFALQHICHHRFLFVFLRTFDTMFFFFFNDTATTEIYTLSLHDALPISKRERPQKRLRDRVRQHVGIGMAAEARSEEHTSELQSQSNLVCRLLLEKKKSSPARPACWPN